MRNGKYYERLEKKQDKLYKQMDAEFKNIMKKYGEETEDGILIDFKSIDKESLQNFKNKYGKYYKKWHGDILK
jgi:hypothetical protein